MLTFEINDVQLEQKIIKKAQSIGKTVQELFKDWIAQETIEEETLPFDVPKLDYREHIKIIDFGIDDAVNKENVPLFSHIGDSAKYVHDLRQKTR